MHLSATLLSPHTVEPLREYGCNYQEAHLSWIFPVFAWLLFCPRFFTCGMFNAKLCEKYDIFLVLSCLASSPFTAPLFFAWSFTSNLVPNTPTSVPPPHVFPAPVVARAAFHFDCFCSVPPLRTSPTEMRVSVLSEPHLALDHKPIPWLPTCFLQSP